MKSAMRVTTEDTENSFVIKAFTTGDTGNTGIPAVTPVSPVVIAFYVLIKRILRVLRGEPLYMMIKGISVTNASSLSSL